MLYPKNQEKSLSPVLFAAPTAEYRGTPFWAWNCKLEEKELLRQIDILQEMGFGGFHMHVRAGMETPYLSKEFMDLVECCVGRAKQKNMLAWLYDEDRWPSGFAGGLITKDPANRMKMIYFTAAPTPQKNEDVKDTLLARYDIVLNEKGELDSYRLLSEGESAEGREWLAFLRIAAPSPVFNNGAYADTLSKKTMDEFIKTTYEPYYERVGKEFGKVIPAIFTDEPQFVHRTSTLPFAHALSDISLPFTTDLPETFRQEFGEDFFKDLPQLVWELPNGAVSTFRYHYYDHVCERFTRAFADNCGAWCRAHGLALTGHMLEEPTLRSQTRTIGEAMRAYRAFELPGIDMLCDRHEFTTAKQTQSAVHQYGREGMMSELYGVTGWDYDFRSHKLHGDWQAALGVTIRVPHLSWVSMKGEAKRDYPASINYQSPWYKQYNYVEDHFARVHTALTRGKPVVRIGVIHPIESYWIHRGPEEQTSLTRKALDENFQNVTNWLLFGGLDFDFISESLLPSLCDKGGAPLQVGEMAYDAIVVPACETLRATTLERLEAFQEAGGKLIFMGSAPRYENAIPSTRPAALVAKAVQISFSRSDLITALQGVRTVEMRNSSGSMTDNLIYALREDNDCRWLFVAKGADPENKDIAKPQELRLRIGGKYRTQLWDTLTGKITDLPCTHKGNDTVIEHTLHAHDSLLLHLVPTSTVEEATATAATPKKQTPLTIPARVAYRLDEPNALLLDLAEYALDDEPYRAEEEILRADTAIRHRLGYTPWGGNACQPWCYKEQPPEHKVRLRFTVDTEIDVTDALLATELPDDGEILLDGKPVALAPIGYYVDRSIRTVKLPVLSCGTHTIELTMPYGERSAVEWCYLLGNFGVSVAGRTKVITKLPEKLAFGSIVSQGLPFYSGKITYFFSVEAEKRGELQLSLPQYRAATALVGIDGGKKQQITFSPYTATFQAEAGKHDVELDLYISRTNGFGPVHLANRKLEWLGPNSYRAKDIAFSYEYILHEEGTLTSPRCVLVEEKEI